MTKKRLKILICSMLACVSILSFSSCNLEAQTAYDIAVKNGFTGTENEWLSSLKGSDGTDAKSPTIDEIYTAWRAESGNENKSFDEFLKQYLNVDYNENNNTAQIAENMTSVVSVLCGMYVREGNKEGWSLSAGSGVIYAPKSNSLENGNAYVITNYHVVYNADAQNPKSSEGYNGEQIVSDHNIFLYLYGTAGSSEDQVLQSNYSGLQDATGAAIKAHYVGGSMMYDVAVLEIKGDDNLKKAAKTGTATAVKICKNGVTAGEKVFAIGNPSGNGISVSQGVVSVESEYITMLAADDQTKTMFHVLRTDAAINPGNSGGGLFNAGGELVGIVNAKTLTSSSGTAVENMGYALPIADVEAVADNVIENKGKALKAYFGIRTAVKDRYSEWNETKEKLILRETVEVTEVYQKSNKESGIGAGKFKKGDEVLSIEVVRDGSAVISNEVYTRADFTNVLLQVRVGDVLRVEVKRGLLHLTLEFDSLQESDLVGIDS